MSSPFDNERQGPGRWAEPWLHATPENHAAGAFDRTTKAASALFRTPMALIIVAGTSGPMVASFVGLPELAAVMDTSLFSQPFWQHTLRSQELTFVEDARDHPLLQGHVMVGSRAARACLGVPLMMSNGSILGTLVLLDTQPRIWSNADIELLYHFTASLTTEIELRNDVERLHIDSQQLAFQAQSIADVNDAVIATTADLCIRFWNNAAERVYGWREEEVLGKPISAVLQVERYIGGMTDAEAHLDLMERGYWKGEVVQVHRGGAKLLIQASVTLMKDQAGVIIGVVTVNRDVTARRDADEALRTSEQHFRSLFEQSVDAIFITSIDGTITDVNRATLELWGGSHADLLGAKIYALQGLPDASICFQEAIAATGAVRSQPLCLRRRDGTTVDTLLTLSARYDNAGTVVGYQGIIRDITQQKQAEAALRQSEEYFRALIERGSEIITVLNPDATVRYTSPAQKSILGHDPDERKGQSTFAMVHPDDRPYAMGVFSKLIHEPGASEACEIRTFHHNGTLRTLEVKATNMVDNPAVNGIVINAHDVTARKQVEEQLNRQLSFTNAITASLGEGVYAVDKQGRLTFINPAAEKILGWTGAELMGQDMHEYIHFQRADGTPFLKEDCDLVSVFNTGQTVARSDDTFTRRDGTLLPVAYTASPIEMNTMIVGAVVTFHDISERKRMEEQLLHEALHDPLTQLPNRSLFFDRLQQALDRVQRHPDQWFAVLFLDLDRFKTINDSLGHIKGDSVLIEAARRLQSCIRPGDTVARLGGDEFALLLEELTTVNIAVEVADRIQDHLIKPFMIEGETITTSASIGIAIGGHGYRQPEDLLRDADIALYRAKSDGRARHVIFNPAMHAQVLQRMRLEADLRRALERDEFVLHYQPFVSMRDSRVVGVEALVRWNHPERGLVSPAEFIPMAEETGLIVPLGEWILRTACRQLKQWHAGGMPPLYVAVNIAAPQFKSHGFCNLVSQILEETGLASKYLELELTESILMDDANETINTLRELSTIQLHSLAVDDFGTGYSSLSYLQRFPIATLKIDRTFVRDIETNASNAAIARAVIALAQSLSLTTVAEGVESVAQLDFLRTHGCDTYQGYLFSAPLPPEKLAALVAAYADTQQPEPAA
ncbi:MAG: hypothetical protein NVSMB42_13360 [Herpetosiphon sp.]